MIAGRGLPFGPRQRILFAGFRMQEHRKILTNLAESHGKHVLASCADDTPVTLAYREAEHLIADRAANQVDLHRRIVSMPVRAVLRRQYVSR